MNMIVCIAEERMHLMIIHPLLINIYHLSNDAVVQEHNI